MNQTQINANDVAGASNTEAFMKMFGEHEDLDPELEQYLDEDSEFGSIRHPLVYSIMHIPQMNAYVNKQLRAKQARVEEAWENGEWHSYVFFHERPYRVSAFDRIADEMDDADYWDLLGEIWRDSENIRQNPEVWPALLRADRPEREAIMDDDERAALAAMPDQIPVFQGHTGARDDGWSWTTERRVAEWFAHRFAMLEDDIAVLTEGVVDKADVVAYFTGRNEYEILVPHELVRDITSTNLPPKADNS